MFLCLKNIFRTCERSLELVRIRLLMLVAKAEELCYSDREIVKNSAYLDLARIFLLLRFSLRIRFLRHFALISTG